MTAGPPGFDAKALVAGMQKVAQEWGRIARRFAEGMDRLMAAFAPLIRRTKRQRDVAQHGPRNVAGDGTWQTDLCAAWLHDSCPSRHCDCTCHGGTVR